MTGSAFAETARPWVYLPDFAREALPRYTSYPPANRFHSNVSPADVDRSFASLPHGASISIYLHIPYCHQLCWYCGCNTSVPTQANPVEPYLEALHAEIKQIGAKLPNDARVTHVHVGGGSPDTLRAAQFHSLFAALNQSFRFDPKAEIAVELDPRGVSGDLAWAMRESGVNRASLGVQTLDEEVQRRINRIQSRDQILEAVGHLNDAGIPRLNMDIMYGLPGQTIAHVVETAEFAADHSADRVAVFGYAHVPWFKKHQGAIRSEELPGGEARFRQAEAAAATLRLEEYVAIGFDHFAAPGDSLSVAARSGKLRRNFQGYTDDQADALIGLGASAISSLPGLYSQNETDARLYRFRILSGQSAMARGAAITADDARRSKLIENVLCQFEADVELDLAIPALARLRRLEAAGLVEFDSGHLRITTIGRPYARNVAASFDAEFASMPGRHSLAV